MARPSTRDPETPAALLGRHLKRIRLAAGFVTQAALAARLDGYGEDVVSKGETGVQPPTEDCLLKWLDLCQASDEARVYIIELWEVVRSPNASGVIPPFAEPWLRVEGAASIIHIWALDVMPGLLQTYDYAFAMFVARGMSEDKAAAKAAARVKRQSILDGDEPTRVTAILYEPLLNRLVGTPQIMAGELANLLALSQRPSVIIQVVREAGYFPGFEGQFEIASGRTIPDTLCMVTVQDQTTNTPAVVDEAIVLFEEIRGYAVTVTESRVIIQEALQRWSQQ